MLLRKSLSVFVSAVVISLVSVGNADAADCTHMFVGGQAPQVLVQHTAALNFGLCYHSYATVTSGVTRTALWSAEELTSASVADAREQVRDDEFHPDALVPAQYRAELIDFEGSRKDRGHMTPSGDAPNAVSQYETFSLANMIPQDPDNNRHLWQGIEISVRRMAKADGELYVVTGPAFIGPRTRIGGRVEVPTHIWKAVYDPLRGAAAYVTRNAPGFEYAVVSIAELRKVIGLDPFPALPESVKAGIVNLPTPRPSGRAINVGPVPPQQLGFDVGNEVSSLDGTVSDASPRYAGAAHLAGYLGQLAQRSRHLYSR